MNRERKDGENEFIYINSGSNTFDGVNGNLHKTKIPYRGFIKNTKRMKGRCKRDERGRIDNVDG